MIILLLKIELTYICIDRYSMRTLLLLTQLTYVRYDRYKYENLLRRTTRKRVRGSVDEPTPWHVDTACEGETWTRRTTARPQL